MKIFVSLLLFIGLSYQGIGQATTGSSFKKIEFAMYDCWDSVRTYYYCMIDEKGNADMQVSNNARTWSYANTLNDTMMAKLRSIFNTQKKLKGYMVSNKLKGMHYAGTYRYINITYPTTKETLCYIEPFMSESFNAVMNELDKALETNSTVSAKQIITPALNKTIASLHRENKKLPKFELPPPEMPAPKSH